MSRLDGRRALILGGTHGIGLATAIALRDRGAEVLVTGRHADAAVPVLGAERVIEADVRDRARLDEVAVRAAALDLLFVNVGTAELAPWEQVTEAGWDRTFDVNVRGPFFAVQRLLPQIVDGGAIVFTTSIANDGGHPGMAVYSASKAALWSLARVLAAELAPRRIRVNAVSPGYVDTPTLGVESSTADERRAFAAQGAATTPLGRIGRPEEIAAAVLFLAFDAPFVTGVQLAVDGGLGQGLSPPHP
jgi:NAD(P)-dependent dehydrogenase (short-subunit alcohol dehydrogenase family)